MTEQNSEMFAREQERTQIAQIGELLKTTEVVKAHLAAEKMNMSPKEFIHLMTKHARFLDIAEKVQMMSESGESMEFLKSPETENAAIELVFRELDARLIEAAFQVIDLFHLSEQTLRSEQVQVRAQDAAIATLKKGNYSGVIGIVGRFKIDSTFLKSTAVIDAAIEGREALRKLSGAKIPSRIAQLEADFNLPPLE